MNLASRCREAIAQAATLKKELVAQKKKTVEAVSQTHQLLSELKKMKNVSPDKRRQRQTDAETPSISTEDTIASTTSNELAKSPESISTKSSIPASTPEEDCQSDASEPKNHDTSTANGLVSSDDYEPPGQESPRPDAPASFEDDSEEQDTVADTIPQKTTSFPASASPNVPRRFPSLKDNGSYDEEYPSDLSCQSAKSSKRSLLSSIDAFEASFNTSFPTSFTPKEGDESNEAYDPFDTNSPQKRNSDPPGDAPLSPRIDRSPRDTIPNGRNKSNDSRKQGTVRNIKTSDETVHSDATKTQLVGERLADRFHKSIDSSNKRLTKDEEVVAPRNGTESMVSRLKKNLTSQSPEDHLMQMKNSRSKMSSRVVSPPSEENDATITQDTPTSVSSSASTRKVSHPDVAVVVDPLDPLDRYKMAIQRDNTNNDTLRRPSRSVSAPRGGGLEHSNNNNTTFASTRAQYERTLRHRHTNDGEIPMQSSIPAKPKVTRSWQRPKALLLAGDEDDDGAFRQRRNVNLSKATRRADFGSQLVTTPKGLGR